MHFLGMPKKSDQVLWRSHMANLQHRSPYGLRFVGAQAVESRQGDELAAKEVAFFGGKERRCVAPALTRL